MNKPKATILSLSLVTVMSGAAVVQDLRILSICF